MENKNLIDLDHLGKYVGGDDALRDEILAIFGDQAESLNQQFSVEQSDDDWRDTAHALKGASRGVGAWALGDLCEAAEQLVGELAGKQEKRAALLVSLRGQVKETLACVRELRGLVSPELKTA